MRLFQLHFSYSYFISVTVTFQLLSSFQLQLTDLKYFSYCPLKPIELQQDRNFYEAKGYSKGEKGLRKASYRGAVDNAVLGLV